MERYEVPTSTHDGVISVDVEGLGPLVLCVPGMGESKASFRHLVPGLMAAGFRVAVMDLRGHGDSSVRFDSYDDIAAASDIGSVLARLNCGPAAIIGNSMGAAASVIAAADDPTAIRQLVLIGPFVRDHGTALSTTLMLLALARPWGPKVWKMYYRSLFGDNRPVDHQEHIDRANDLLLRPGRWRAFHQTVHTSHAPAEAALPRVTADVLVLMGDKDPDFSPAKVEAQWVADSLNGSYTMIEGAGHYPMGEQPQSVLKIIVPFLKGTTK